MMDKSLEILLDGGSNRGKEEVTELEFLPENIRSLFVRLPAEVKARILGKDLEDDSADFFEKEEDIVEVVSTFKPKEREDFAELCLRELFICAKIRERFRDASQDVIFGEIGRLLDLLWQNRRRTEDIIIFNQEYYDSFEIERKKIKNEIITKRNEISGMKKSIQSTIKQRRLTSAKNKQLDELDSDLDSLGTKLRDFDIQNGNSDYDHAQSNDIDSRKKGETKWTKAIALVSQYFEPDEFATLLLERLELTFFREFRICRDEVLKSKHSDEVVRKARIIVEAVSSIINKWIIDHGTEKSLKSSSDAKSDKRISTVISYLISLIGSYKRGQYSERSDEDMLVTIRQMEVAINILGK